MIVSGLSLVMFLAAAVAGPMEKVELKVPGRVVACVPADVNGDGLSDLLLFWRQGVPPQSKGRISVFLGRAGKIQDKAKQIMTLPQGTVSFDVGDADGDSRADVLLLKGDGVWMLKGTAQGLLQEKPKQLVKAMTLAAMAHEDHVPPVDLLLDLDGRGRKGLLVPTVPIGPLALYAQDDTGKFKLLAMLRVPSRSNTHTEREDLLSARDYSAVYLVSMPRFRLIDQNGDGQKDLLFFKQDALHVFLARADGGFDSEASYSRTFGLLSEDDRIKRGVFIRGDAADFNLDGRADLVFNKALGGITNMHSETWVFMADGKGAYPARPSVSVSGDGYGALARATDVDGDGAADLIRPYVAMGIMALTQVLLSGKLNVLYHVHLSNKKDIGPKPSYSLSSPIAVNFKSNQELSGPYPIMDQDFDGDGKNDVVIGQAGGGSGKEPDSLEVRPGLGAKGPDGDAMWSTPMPGTRFVMTFRMRSEDRPGLLLYFPMVDGRQGDVWLFHNRGKWER